MPVNLQIIDNVAVLEMNNEKKLNVLNTDVMHEIYNCLDNIEQKAKVLVIFGCDRAFAAGDDLNEIDTLDYEQAQLLEFMDSKWERVLHTKIPVIAGVQGYALGGGFELALMCDMIIASEDAVFGFPEVNLGLMPGLGGTQQLAKIVGTKKATEMIMMGDFITATQASELKIINKIINKGNFEDEVLQFAKKLASKPSLSLLAIKEALTLSQNVGRDEGMKVERYLFRALCSTSDKKKLVSNFLSKRRSH
ncbi:MAG: enoyl-CoA hydratase/isomerase family protein [Alphaproteobacteria bacterium]|nr:enoyl-CoA hydratase/isomerase family protein [Alphaproteobacteria bacterium]